MTCATLYMVNEKMFTLLTSTPTKSSLSEVEYNDLLEYQASKHTSPPISSIAQTGHLVGGISRSTTLGHWVMVSGASDHISSNKYFMFSITPFLLLP